MTAVVPGAGGQLALTSWTLRPIGLKQVSRGAMMFRAQNVTTADGAQAFIAFEFGGLNLTPAAATLTLTGVAPVLVQNANFTPAATSNLILTGVAPIVVQNTPLSPAAATLTLTGVAPTLSLTDFHALTPAAATLTLTGVAPSIILGIMPPAATLTLAGVAPTLALTDFHALTPTAATLVLTSDPPTVVVSGGIVTHNDEYLFRNTRRGRR